MIDLFWIDHVFKTWEIYAKEGNTLHVLWCKMQFFGSINLPKIGQPRGWNFAHINIVMEFYDFKYTIMLIVGR